MKFWLSSSFNSSKKVQIEEMHLLLSLSKAKLIEETGTLLLSVLEEKPIEEGPNLLTVCTFEPIEELWSFFLSVFSYRTDRRYLKLFTSLPQPIEDC